MNKENEQLVPINTKAIIFAMLLLSVIVHVGFGVTYIREFPVFQKYNWVHHIHGALMGAWVMLLIVQPLFIHLKKFTTHRFLGKLSFVLAPCMLVSMVLVARINYESGILKNPATGVIAVQSITWMQIVLFALFYSQAVYFRKNTFYHMRFMISTAIVMLGPPLNRAIHYYFPEIPVTNVLLMVLYIKTGLILALLLSDIAKKKNWKPYLIVFAGFLFSDIVFHARYSGAWQAAGGFIVDIFY
jgi:hypothetical protein